MSWIVNKRVSGLVFRFSHAHFSFSVCFCLTCLLLKYMKYHLEDIAWDCGEVFTWSLNLESFIEIWEDAPTQKQVLTCWISAHNYYKVRELLSCIWQIQEVMWLITELNVRMYKKKQKKPWQINKVSCTGAHTEYQNRSMDHSWENGSPFIASIITVPSPVFLLSLPLYLRPKLRNSLCGWRVNEPTMARSPSVDGYCAFDSSLYLLSVKFAYFTQEFGCLLSKTRPYLLAVMRCAWPVRSLSRHINHIIYFQSRVFKWKYQIAPGHDYELQNTVS